MFVRFDDIYLNFYILFSVQLLTYKFFKNVKIHSTQIGFYFKCIICKKNRVLEWDVFGFIFNVWYIISKYQLLSIIEYQISNWWTYHQTCDFISVFINMILLFSESKYIYLEKDEAKYHEISLKLYILFTTYIFNASLFYQTSIGFLYKVKYIQRNFAKKIYEVLEWGVFIELGPGRGSTNWKHLLSVIT